MDGQLPIGVETAMLKAKTALYARTPSSAVAQRFNTVDGRVIRLQLGQSSGLAYYFVGGGLPIVVQDQLIGAIGVGGGLAAYCTAPVPSDICFGLIVSSKWIHMLLHRSPL